jgi:pimeloyl-ACP methyl ester carboxylesterase
MSFMPFNILGIWFRGLLSVAIISAGIYLLKCWYDESNVVIPVRPVPTTAAPTENGEASARLAPATVPAKRVFSFQPGLNRETAYLASAVALLAWAIVGGWVHRGLSMMLGGLKPAPGAAADEPVDDRTGEIHRITRPDGSELRVECYGPADGPPLVMTHGWGCDSTEWFYLKKHLAGGFRLILWDEPGLGLSKKPDNNDYRMEKLAADLEAVLAFAGGQPAILAGHSIGGMITLTFCKLFHDSLGPRVAGIILAHTSYTNPVRTTKMAGLYTAIEKPVIVPLLFLTIGLWPLVWLMNWLSYLNGSAHRSTHNQSFSGTETRGELDFFARFMPRARPDVLARGMLGMIDYDATAILPTIPVPTLVVVGDQDTTTLPSAGLYISKNVPNAQLATLSPAKHLGLIEHHARFDELVSGFAESCLSTDRPSEGFARRQPTLR